MATNLCRIRAVAILGSVAIPALCILPWALAAYPLPESVPELQLENYRPEIPTAPPGAAPAPGERRVTPRMIVHRGFFTSVQVNVDSTGNNIGGDAANEPSIAVDPTNPSRMAIGWRQFDSILSDFRKGGWGYTTDAGASWAFPGTLEPAEFASDPVLTFDTSGTFYYYSLQPNRGPGSWACYMYTSADGGATWPVETYAYGGDKAWVTVDRTGGMGDGNIYVAWSQFAGCCPGATFTRSTDGGATYMTPIALLGQPRWGTLTVAPDGDLYIAGITTLAGSPIGITKSSNAQNSAVTPTWDFVKAVNLDGQLQIGVGPNPGGLLGQVQIASDHSGGPNHGAIYVLATVARNGGIDPADVMFSRSLDGGDTWSAPLRVNDDTPGNNAWQWFATMSVAPNGRIDVVWNDTRSFVPQENISELYYSWSDDGGLSWAQNQPVSPAFNSFIGWPQQNKIGDYYDMISEDLRVNVAYSATFSGEQDVYYLALSRDCNGNGIADEIDISGGFSQDVDGDGIPDECTPSIPALGNLGMVTTLALMLIAAGWIIRRRVAGGAPSAA